MFDAHDQTGFDALLAAARASKRPIPSAEELDEMLLAITRQQTTATAAQKQNTNP